MLTKEWLEQGRIIHSNDNVHFSNMELLRECSLSLMQGPRRSLPLSLIFFLLWDPWRSQAQKLWGLWCLSNVQGPIHLYYKPDLGCTIRTLCMCNSSEVVITETDFHPQMEHQRWVSPISTPLTFMWLDACMRMTDGKKMMSAFFGRYNLQYPPLFVFELHRIRSGRMINIETRASILLIHL